SYQEGIEITKDDIYKKLKEHGEGAGTSQPSYGEFIELYEKLKNEYDCGIAIHASKELTGTYDSSVRAAKQTGFPVEVIDSKMGTYAFVNMIKDGIELEKHGASYEEIIDTIHSYTDQSEMYLLPESMNQLKNSGRVSTPQTIFASLLHINLLLGFDHGKVAVGEKTRTKRKARQRLLRRIGDGVNTNQLRERGGIDTGVKERAGNWDGAVREVK